MVPEPSSMLTPGAEIDSQAHDLHARDEHPHEQSRLRRVLGVLPTFVILAVLFAVGFWGHHSAWTLPKFGDLTGSASSTKTEDWCELHSVPLSQCVECNLEKYPRPENFGWCEKHGVHNCPEDHPEVAQVEGKPQMPKYDTLKALSAVDRQPNGPKCTLHIRRLQIASQESEIKLGIEFDVVAERPMTDQITAIAEVIYDPTTVARLFSPVSGRIWQVRKKLGDGVQQGELLALIDSPHVASAKADFTEAVISAQIKKKRYDTLVELSKTTSVPRLSLLEAQSEQDEAGARVARHAQVLANLGLNVPEGFAELEMQLLAEKIRFLGIPKEIAAELKNTTTSSSLFPLKAPHAGTVIAADLVAGEFIETSAVLLVIANRRQMLLAMNIPAEHAKYVRAGLPVRFTPDTGEAKLSGKIDWISSSVDDKTRMLEVRATLDAVNDNTRANTFGSAFVILREEPMAITVPREAVQWEGCCNVVFVRDKDYRKPGAPKVIHVRKVRPGAHDDKYIELIAGVLPGEVVVTKGANIMRAEMLRSNLGAG